MTQTKAKTTQKWQNNLTGFCRFPCGNRQMRCETEPTWHNYAMDRPKWAMARSSLAWDLCNAQRDRENRNVYFWYWWKRLIGTMHVVCTERLQFASVCIDYKYFINSIVLVVVGFGKLSVWVSVRACCFCALSVNWNVTLLRCSFLTEYKSAQTY